MHPFLPRHLILRSCFFLLLLSPPRVNNESLTRIDKENNGEEISSQCTASDAIWPGPFTRPSVGL